MNFLQLRYFKTAAEQEHITKAANQLYISQPALSKAIRLLEQEVGYSLFDREGTGIRLNENGRIFYRYTANILEALENAVSEISDINGNNHRVILSMTAGTGFLPDIILGIKECYPQITLEIRQEDIRNHPHHSDLYLHSSTNPMHSDSSMTLLSEMCLLGVSKENPLAQKQVITPQMLQNEIFLTMQDSQPLYRITQELCKAGGFSPRTNLQFDNRETIYDLIHANMGVSIIPAKTWAPYIRQDKIALRPLSLSYFRYIILQWPEEHYLSGDMRTVIHYLENYFRHLDAE